MRNWVIEHDKLRLWWFSCHRYLINSKMSALFSWILDVLVRWFPAIVVELRSHVAQDALVLTM